MIDLYYWPTPNGHKITLFLEEAGLDYRIHPVNIGKGDQFQPEFLAISPNNRLPADFDAFPHLHRWHWSIAECPATQRPAPLARRSTRIQANR